MPYISSVERRAMEKGREEGRRFAYVKTIATKLQSNFPVVSDEIIAKIKTITDEEVLQLILDAAYTNDIDQVRRLISE